MNEEFNMLVDELLEVDDRQREFESLNTIEETYCHEQENDNQRSYRLPALQKYRQVKLRGVMRV